MAGKLKINRRDGESIVIGNVIVQVLQCRKGRVSLRIIADEEVRIFRGEMFREGRRAGEIEPIPNEGAVLCRS